MNWKTKTVIALVVATMVAGGAWVLWKKRSPGGVTVTLRIGVAPEQESGAVMAQANSARFKYLMGKQSGVKPVQAQKLEVKRPPNSPQLEARVIVTTPDQARRYAEVFLPALQEECGAQVRLTLIEESIR